MLKVIPYILVVLAWPTGAPQDQAVFRTQLVMSQEECREQGDEFLASRKIYAEELPKLEHRYFCIEAPRSEDYRALYAQ